MKTRTLLQLTLPLAGLLWAVSGLWGQAADAANPNRLVVTLSHPGEPAHLEVSVVNGAVHVHGYAGNQVLIDSSGGRTRSRNVPAEAQGMLRLTPAPGVSAEQNNNRVTIHSAAESGDFDIQVPAGSSVSLHTVEGSALVEGVQGELEVKSVNGSVTLTQVGGSVVADTVNGEITATLVRVDADKPSSFTTLNGRINVTLPAAVRASLTMRSDRGDVYMDKDFTFKTQPSGNSATTGSKEEEKEMVKIKPDNTVRGDLNGGGVALNFRSYNGGIYIHRGQ